MKQAEHFNPPSQQQSEYGAGYEANAHGFDGPVGTGFFTPVRLVYLG